MRSVGAALHSVQVSGRGVGEHSEGTGETQRDAKGELGLYAADGHAELAKLLLADWHGQCGPPRH
eukprot:15102209-Alexandrium_andersonii.AAC.1